MMVAKKTKGLIIPLTIIGFFIGGTVGFLYRPSAFIVGQLPFDTVITRGANLKGMEQVLIPIAQNSFNNMMAAAVIGALIGLAIGFLVSRR